MFLLRLIIIISLPVSAKYMHFMICCIVVYVDWVGDIECRCWQYQQTGEWASGSVSSFASAHYSSPSYSDTANSLVLRASRLSSENCILVNPWISTLFLIVAKMSLPKRSGHTGLTYLYNFWHSDTLALTPDIYWGRHIPANKGVLALRTLAMLVTLLVHSITWLIRVSLFRTANTHISHNQYVCVNVVGI